MGTIGLIAAMPQESNALLGCIQGWKRTRLGGLRGARFELSGQTCLLVTSGMGIQRARQAALLLMDAEPLECLVSFGIAGAVEADLEIGDVIAVEAVCLVERGEPGPRMPLGSWSEAARKAAVQAISGRGAHLFSGTALTTAGEPSIKIPSAGMQHPILEMETAGIAQAAAEKGMPLFALRAISDGPQAPLPFDIGGIMDENANLQAGRLLKTILRNPGLILRSGAILRNSRLAADNAALALLAALAA